MPHQNCWSATLTKVVSGGREEGLRLLPPFGVVATLVGSGPFHIEPGFTVPIVARHARARHSRRNGLSALADTWRANWHDQATGLSTALPLTAMTLAKIDVPLPLVRTGRTYRLKPLYPSLAVLLAARLPATGAW